jgi:hypothetical protein
MKKIVVVGGGITGCISALHLSEKGYNVELFESSVNLGGVIKDSIFNGHAYLTGPQYLNTDSEWIKKLLEYENINKAVRRINLQYASFNDLFGEEIFKKDFAQLATSVNFRTVKKKKNTTLLSRLKCYQKNISAPLQDWLKRFAIKYDKIHNNCAKTLSISRVLFLNDVEKIRLLKKSNNQFDELLGLVDLKYQSNQAFLPTNGFDKFFFELKKIMIKKNIRIFFGSKILLRKNDHNLLSVYNKNNEIICDYVLWTANPVPLIKNLTGELLDNPFNSCFMIFMNFLKIPQDTKDFYIQVFSKKSNISRIFIYKDKKTFKLTAEGVSTEKKIDLESEINFIKKILNYFCSKSEVSETYQIKKFLKHNLYTSKDYNLMKKIKNTNSETKFIHGAWDVYERDKKIMDVFQNIQKAGL